MKAEAPLMANQNWDGRPANPEVGSWYWLTRRDGPDLRHAAWYWCEDCHQWEVLADLSFSAEQVAKDGWQLLSAANPPETVDARNGAVSRLQPEK